MCTKLHSGLKNCVFQLTLRNNVCSKLFYLSFSTSNSLFRNFRSPIKFSKPHKIGCNEEENEDEDENESSNKLDNKEIDLILDKSSLILGSGHQVLVIQPFIKWGVQKKKNTTPKLQLLEAVTLIKTLRQWKVVDEIIIPLQTYHNKFFFGKGNLKALKEKIISSSVISAVFISTNTLSLVQQIALQETFEVPVFDRYSIIMHIFKEHAQTKEAKLQIQLAQLPYAWKILGGFNMGFAEKFGLSSQYLGGEGITSLERRRESFRQKEARLKKEILELREKREEIRLKRSKSEIPVVAVLGYTNAGKTALIKALSGKESLKPEDYLFATLDVTSHLGELPSGLKVFFLDTLGFISDIPTYLIESFILTLQDAVNAHVIIHVRDISHPDTVSQNDNVLDTLKQIKMSEKMLNNMITVGNKIDLLETEELRKYKDLILVSSTKMTGIDILRQEIEKKVLVSTDKKEITIRLESGSEEYCWLHEHSNVVSETPDAKNCQYMLVRTIISPSALSKFKYYFIKNYKK